MRSVQASYPVTATPPPPHLLDPFYPQARIETGFVSRFVAPFFASMRKQLPQLACCEETISSNLELWAEVADGTQSGPLEGADTPAEGAADCHTALARQQECVRRWQQLPTLLKPEELALTPN